MQSNQKLNKHTTSLLKSLFDIEPIQSFPSYIYEQKKINHSINKFHKVLKENLMEKDNSHILQEINKTLMTFPTVLIRMILDYLLQTADFGTVIIANLILIQNNEFFSGVFQKPENCTINIYLALDRLANGKKKIDFESGILKISSLAGKNALEILRESAKLSENNDLLLGINFLLEHEKKPTHSITLASHFKNVAQSKITLGITPEEEKILEKEIDQRGLATSVMEYKTPEKLIKNLELLQIKHYGIQTKLSHLEVVVTLRDAQILQNIFQAQPLIKIIDAYLALYDKHHQQAKKLALYITKHFLDDKAAIEKLQSKISQQISTTTDKDYSEMLRYIDNTLTRMMLNKNNTLSRS